MKTVIIFAALFAVAVAAPPRDSGNAEVLRLESDVRPEGYNFILETSDGKNHQEQGQLKNAGSENAAIAVSGSYSFIGDDGQTYKVDYIADENGFQPSGAHLPHA